MLCNSVEILFFGVRKSEKSESPKDERVGSRKSPESPKDRFRFELTQRSVLTFAYPCLPFPRGRNRRQEFMNAYRKQIIVFIIARDHGTWTQFISCLFGLFRLSDFGLNSPSSPAAAYQSHDPANLPGLPRRS